MSLRLRLVLILVPLFIAGLVAADFGTYLALRSSLLQQAQTQLLAAHVSLEDELFSNSADFGPPNGGSPSGPGPGGLYPGGTFVEVLGAGGTVVAGPEVFPRNEVSSTTHPALPSQLPPDKTFLTVGGSGSVQQYLVYVDNSDHMPGGTVIAAFPLDSVNSTLGSLLVFELAISGGIILIVIAATWLMVRRGLRPLERMGATARSIAATDLSKRVEPSSERTEVGRLGLALNAMFAQLESAFAERAESEQRLRHFVSDASHELRTPLTSMGGYAELLRRNPNASSEDVALALRRIEEESARMG
ncbi:MAG: HAMP domain-containing protein, partial [Candidatus Dormibacteraeota bacterium]|nr:HAMP domain-containing protein [Candidatus Dormibacteraeota bacterium]